VKITITVPNVGAAGATTFVLADDSVSVVPGSNASTNFTNGAGGLQKEGLCNKQKRTVQKSPTFRAPYQTSFPRYNLANSFSFSVQRSFQTPEACMAFVRSHADNVPVQGEITVLESSATGQSASYLPNALVESIETIQHQEQACLTRYTISGNGAWQTTP
jgi:hypothetical protein